MAAITLVTSSGMLVPTATTMKPIICSLKKFLNIPVTPLINISEPNANANTATIILNIALAIELVLVDDETSFSNTANSSLSLDITLYK